MGTLIHTGDQARFTYDGDYKGPGISVLFPPDKFRRLTVTWPHFDHAPVHPVFQALIPPPGSVSGPNLQRVCMTRLLERRGIRPAAGLDMEWTLLTQFGHGGIGHIDVFDQDQSAERYYSQSTQSWSVDTHDQNIAESLASLMRMQIVVDNAIPMSVGSATAGGMMHKILVSIPAKGWDGRIGSRDATQIQGESFVPVVLKVAPPEYKGIVPLERLCLDAHDRVGDRVPDNWGAPIADLVGLAVKRFDRDDNGHPLPLETLHAIVSTIANREISATQHPLENVWKVLSGGIQEIPCLLTKPAADAQILFERVTLSLLTGNGDLHLQNLSVQEIAGAVSLSPVYDPAPMRAWARHDILSANRFGGLNLDRSLMPSNLFEGLIKFGVTLEIQPSDVKRIIERCLDATSDYRDRLQALSSEEGLAGASKALIDAVAPVRERIQAGVSPKPLISDHMEMR